MIEAVIERAVDQATASWQQFVLEHGYRARAHELAKVLDVTEQKVLAFRVHAACKHREHGLPFQELFELRHGRPPVEADWPKPAIGARGVYEWQLPEVALLASLVGQLGPREIAAVLTERLRLLTGDPAAERSRNAVLVRMGVIGLQTTDVIGGITITEAAAEIGSTEVVRDAIEAGRLSARKVGRLFVIPHEAWKEWKARRNPPPEGYVQLSSIRELLGIRSDAKLPEFAKLGYIPTAVRCDQNGASASTRGTWFIDPDVAAQLVVDRRRGRPMPWHGKPILENLRTTFRNWQARMHPVECQACATIWGSEAAPKTFEDYVRRYPSLEQGAKRHLTRPWAPGLTISEVAADSGCSVTHVKRAIDNGLLASAMYEGVRYVARTEATRWKARNCPAGDGDRSWLSLATACKMYQFTIDELRGFIASGRLLVKLGTDGAMRGIEYVGRHQCGLLRAELGFTEAQAAARLGIDAAQLPGLLAGATWRCGDGIPLETLNTIQKRIESHSGYSLQEAADALGVSLEWVNERKDDGTIRVLQTKWESGRIYISEPMLDRLREALRNPPAVRGPMSDEWLHLAAAAREAGVSTSSLSRWGLDGLLETTEVPRGTAYSRRSIRAQARIYWRTVRFLRATPPEWLRIEQAQQAKPEAADVASPSCGAEQPTRTNEASHA